MHGHTTIVLGAGAGRAYGFPVGDELRQRIASDPVTRRLRDCGFDAVDVESFGHDLVRSRHPTIDQFLRAEQHHAVVGKAAIAIVLGQCERPDRLLFAKPHEDVYRLIFDAFCADGGFGRSDLTIITLNYDRSLERYLFVRARNAFPLLSELEVGVRIGYRICHWHGSLGFLPEIPSMRSSDHHHLRPYTDKMSEEDILGASRGIMVLGGERRLHTLTAAFKDGRSPVYRSRLVAFLGFGYHRQVLDDLECAELDKSASRLQPSSRIEFVGSAFGLSKKRRCQALAKIPGLRLAPEGEDAMDAIRRFSIFEPRPAPRAPSDALWNPTGPSDWCAQASTSLWAPH